MAVAAARRGAQGARRRPQETCVSNFYPMHFRGHEGDKLHLVIFHCYFFDEDAGPIRAREETELKRQIFDAARREGRQHLLEGALGVHHLVFGGDCAAGVAGHPPAGAHVEPQGGESLVGDAEDRYEALYDGVWLPAVVRAVLPSGRVRAQLYAPGSFWSEGLDRVDDVELQATDIRPRQWEACRGEALRVPAEEVLSLGRGQHLRVWARGPDRDEPAGRLVLGDGAGVRCQGGTITQDGVVECAGLIQLGARQKRYRVEYHSSKRILVDCLEAVPQLPLEERAIALQCFTWVLQRAYRNMRYQTLGGRGYYRMEASPDGDRSPVAVRQTETFHRGRDRQHGPLLWLYRGCVANAVQVSHGPCLKVDFSVRLVQDRSVLDQCNLLRQALEAERQTQGQALPTAEDHAVFLQSKLSGRTCVTTHRDSHYRISRVCLDMSPMDTFPCEGRQISYVEYFEKQYGKRLNLNQPLLHIPRRGNEQRYLPAELGYLTGLEEDQVSDPALMKGIMRHLHQKPPEQWLEQRRLVDGLAGEARPGGALHNWGAQVSQTPLEVPCYELAHEPVYFAPEAATYFDRGEEPPSRLEVPTQRGDGSVGFARRPWPDFWAQEQVHLEHWLVFHEASDREKCLADEFLRDLERLAQEIAQAAGDRLAYAAPRPVAVPGGTAREWLEFLRSYRPPGPGTRLAVLILPDTVGEKSYYQLKNLLTFLGALGGVRSQVVRSATLKRQNREQILKNIAQQVLVKLGAFLWVGSPLCYNDKLIMVVGIDACKQSVDSPAIQTMCASTNSYFTEFYNTWRVRGETRTGVFLCPPGDLLREALLRFRELRGRLPDKVVVYRGGVSESHEDSLLDREVFGEDDGVLCSIRAASEEVRWEHPIDMAYILARRGTHARFRQADGENLPSGTCVGERVVVEREDPNLFDFYMVSQSYVVATARPTLYSVLYSKLQVPRRLIEQLTYRLCGLYMTFPGMVATPAPLKYATELLGQLARCDNVPQDGASDDWQKSCLFFV